MSDDGARRGKRLRTLLRVASIREKQAEAGIARAEVERRDALEGRERNVERLEELGAPGAGTVASLDKHRQRTELRIDAVLASNDAVAVTEAAVEEARIRWQAAARSRRSMEELDRRERAVVATLATRAAERAMDDMLRARRPDGERGFDE